MRPRTLDEFVGQREAVGEGTWLRRAIDADALFSLILYGPAGTGKTSLARLLADAVDADFRTVSAVMSGVAEVRATIAEAQEQLALSGRRSLLTPFDTILSASISRPESVSSRTASRGSSTAI